MGSNWVSEVKRLARELVKELAGWCVGQVLHWGLLLGWEPTGAETVNNEMMKVGGKLTDDGKEVS